MLDYHVHCCASFDSDAHPKDQIAAAKARGITEICFTDHLDLEYEGLSIRPPEPCDLIARKKMFENIDTQGITVLMGAEIGIRDAASAERVLRFLGSLTDTGDFKDIPLDFIIGSVHLCDGQDCYYPEYYAGKTKEYAYRRYVNQICDAAKCSSFYSVIGHYDFCAKYAPYEDRLMTYEMAHEEFDELFHHLAQTGKGIEVNTSAWRTGPSWGLDIIKRYRELGGEIITIGSDGHSPEKVGLRLKEGLDMISTAGFKYVTAFKGLKPNFIPINEVIS